MPGSVLRSGGTEIKMTSFLPSGKSQVETQTVEMRSIRGRLEKERISDQLLLWWGDDPWRLPGRGDIQVEFYRMNRSLLKR